MENCKRDLTYEVIRQGIAEGCQAAHANAKEHGFWDDFTGSPRERAGLLMLMVSELGEACEAMRKGIERSEHISEYTGEEEELADAIIRIFDYAGANGLRLADAIVDKMEFNRTRPHKHGKKF